MTGAPDRERLQPPGQSQRNCLPSCSPGVVVLGIDFKSKRRERIYDADKIWSGEHTMLDYTEV